MVALWLIGGQICDMGTRAADMRLVMGLRGPHQCSQLTPVHAHFQHFCLLHLHALCVTVGDRYLLCVTVGTWYLPALGREKQAKVQGPRELDGKLRGEVLRNSRMNRTWKASATVWLRIS